MFEDPASHSTTCTSKTAGAVQGPYAVGQRGACGAAREKVQAFVVPEPAARRQIWHRPTHLPRPRCPPRPGERGCPAASAPPRPGRRVAPHHVYFCHRPTCSKRRLPWSRSRRVCRVPSPDTYGTVLHATRSKLSVVAESELTEDYRRCIEETFNEQDAETLKKCYLTPRHARHRG